MIQVVGTGGRASHTLRESIVVDVMELTRVRVNEMWSGTQLRLG